MPSACLFCGVSGTTKSGEHAYPAWTAECVPGAGDMLVTWEADDGEITERRAVKLDIKVTICKACNEGWMAKGRGSRPADALPTHGRTSASRACSGPPKHRVVGCQDDGSARSSPSTAAITARRVRPHPRAPRTTAWHRGNLDGRLRRYRARMEVRPRSRSIHWRAEWLQLRGACLDVPLRARVVPGGDGVRSAASGCRTAAARQRADLAAYRPGRSSGRRTASRSATRRSGRWPYACAHRRQAGSQPTCRDERAPAWGHVRYRRAAACTRPQVVVISLRALVRQVVVLNEIHMWTRRSGSSALALIERGSQWSSTSTAALSTWSSPRPSAHPERVVSRSQPELLAAFGVAPKPDADRLLGGETGGHDERQERIIKLKHHPESTSPPRRSAGRDQEARSPAASPLGGPPGASPPGPGPAAPEAVLEGRGWGGPVYFSRAARFADTPLRASRDDPAGGRVVVLRLADAGVPRGPTSTRASGTRMSSYLVGRCGSAEQR